MSNVSSTTGPNRNRFRLAPPHSTPTTDEEHRANWHWAESTYGDSLINLDVGAKIGYVGADFATASATLSDIAGWNTVHEDPYGFGFPFGTGRLKVPRGLEGRYLCRATATASNNTITNPMLMLKFFAGNGANYINMADTYSFPASIVFARFQVLGVRYFRSGDALGAAVYHESGANRSWIGNPEIVNNIDPPAPTLEMWRIGLRG